MAIDKFSKQQFEDTLFAIHPNYESLGLLSGEEVYTLQANSHARLTIRSSIDASGYAADSGTDSIRLWLEVLTPSLSKGAEWRSVGRKVDAYTQRTKGWEKRLESKVRILWERLVKFQQPVELCPECQSVPKVFIVKKDGKNKDRPFAKCQDHYFQWLDEPLEKGSKVEFDDSFQVLDAKSEQEISSDAKEGIDGTVSMQAGETILDSSEQGNNASESYTSRRHLQALPQGFEQLNRYQQELISAIVEGGTVIGEACPGSGKTRTMEMAVSTLILNGTDPSRIGVFTFSRKSAAEARRRIAQTILPDISPEELEYLETLQGDDVWGMFDEPKPEREMIKNWVCTIHALAYRLLKAQGQKVKALAGQKKLRWDAEAIVKDGLKELNWNEGPKAVWAWIAYAINSLIEPENSFSFYQDTLMALDGPDRAYELSVLYQRYISYMNQHGLVDFDMMQASVVKLIQASQSFRDSLADMFDYVFIDEAQDNNSLQNEIIEALTKKGNLVMIGDVDQCQPPGTNISLTGGGHKNIEDITVGDVIVSYDRHAAAFVGTKCQGRKVLGVSKRRYEGEILAIRADTKTTVCTPNHIWLARFSERSTDINVTYLMRRGDRYRIGWCQLFNVAGLNHLKARARMEKADAAWILTVHNNKADASAWESLIATEFGLPLVVFEPSSGAYYYTREWIDFVFNGLNDLENRAIRCLENFHRDIRYPFWDKNTWKRNGRTTLFEIRACNLISGMMKVPVYDDETNKPNWTTIEVDYHEYCGSVYSLDVETHNMYVADGIATHNCLYAFRGASPEVLRSFEDGTHLNLPINYRSTQSIIKASSQLISHSYQEGSEYLKPFQAKPEAPEGSELSYSETEDFNGLIQEIITDIAEYEEYDFGKWAILSRTRAECAAIHTGLIAAGIPAINHSGGLLFGSPHIRKVLAYAMLACDYNGARDNLEILGEIANVASASFKAPMTRRRHESWCDAKPWEDCGCTVIMQEGVDYSHSRFYGQKAIEKAGSWDGIIEQQWEVNKGNYPTLNSKGAKDLVHFVEQVERKAHDAYEALAIVIGDCVKPWLAAEEGLTEEDLAENGKSEDFELLLNLTESNQTLEQFLDKIEWLSQASNQQSSQSNAVNIGTIHWSKGAEFERVIVNTTRLPIVPPKLREGALPVGRPATIAEERRLAFVAISRAKSECYLIGSRQWLDNECETSRFVEEIGLC